MAALTLLYKYESSDFDKTMECYFIKAWNVLTTVAVIFFSKKDRALCS